MARRRNFRIHQRFMIRSAAVGYSDVAVRIAIPIFAITGLNFWTSAELEALASRLVYVALAEIYIQRALNPRQEQARIQPVQDVEAHDVEAGAKERPPLDDPLKPSRF